MTSHAPQTRTAGVVPDTGPDLVSATPRGAPAVRPTPLNPIQRPEAPVTDHDTTTQQLADIDRRITDLTRPPQEPRWSVFRSQVSEVLSYGLLQRKYWTTVFAIHDVDLAVIYITAKPTAGENPLEPGNALDRVDGDALTCLRLASSHKFIMRPRNDMTLTDADFDRADKGLRRFVADVVALVDSTALADNS